MSSSELNAKKKVKQQLLLPVFVLSAFLGSTGLVIITTLLVDVASSLKVPIGTAGQLVSIVSFSALVLGFVMGALTIRFRHKSLFLLGAALHGIGALGLFFAPDFMSVAFFWLIMGTGAFIVGIMVYSLIGELIPLEKRGWAVGLIVSTSSFGMIFDAPLYGFMSSVGGWRSIPLLFIFPLSIAILSLGFLIIPSKPKQEKPPPSSEYLRVFKQIFSNKSAVACLVGTALFYIMTGVIIYAVSFYRIQFSITPEVGGIFASAAAIGGMFGGVGGGRLINRCGRKTLTSATAFTAALFAILITIVPNVWVSLAFYVASALTTSMAMAALTSLVLEQIPEFRASMMSINSIFGGTGGLLGSTIGGLLLNLYTNNFQILMLFLGTGGIASAAVVFLFAKDPCRKQLPVKSGPTKG